ncbi:uncharacterized protein BP5553_08442 [Venustampulla echinocandica]|uniref:Uncharacterized protein n=1 Tax=Venustampulla echinocandica TaxID=2656787 RepID=A0A370TE90_9HELO|nr:uncharacterized protein BP5553_08442 [Venustampulla echinocandica]RDL33003.1 hypothetical protein BP5553_08442 [Venustampulla echinocandica]
MPSSEQAPVQFDLLGPSWMDSIVSSAKTDSRVKPYQAAVEHEEYQKVACEKKKIDNSEGKSGSRFMKI